MPEKCTGVINLRYKDGSMGSVSNPEMFHMQNFEQLKQWSLRRGSLFVDTTFPPDSNSLGDIPSLQRWQQQQVKWRRPAEIKEAMGFSGAVSFIVDGASRLDFGQGLVGNCWFLAAIGSLTLHKDLLVQVVPVNQSFEEYAGIFHFRFWRFGRWVDVVIDDFLPTFQNQMLSVKSKSGNEFWVPLLEKAYAKLCGSYADMHAGSPSEAFKDFCGGVFMNYELRNEHDNDHDKELWGTLTRATACQAMIGCGTFSANGTTTNTVARNGLVASHAYAVTGVNEVRRFGSAVRLVRLLNPWGSQEWTGKWGDKSDLWNQVSSEDRANCVKREDGEFWMELEDYCHNFNYMSVCCENPNFMDGDVGCQWQCMSYNGRWIAGKEAGGNFNEPTFEQNPQFRFKVSAEAGDDEGHKNLLVSLMQKRGAHRNKSTKNPIGFCVFKLPESATARKLDSSFLRYNLPLIQSKYTYDREIMDLSKVEPGEYFVVPNTMYPNCSGEFLLTIYTKAGVQDHGDQDGRGDHNETPAEEVTPKPTDEEEGEETSDLYKLFKRYTDGNEELSITQLQRLLNNSLLDGNQTGFDLTACRSLVAFSNPQGIQGKIDYPVFAKLWKKCISYKELFDRCDTDHSGMLSLMETMNAAQSRDIPVDPHTIITLTFRYSGFTTSVPLAGFVALMLQVESNNDGHHYYDRFFQGDGGFSKISILDF